MGHHHQHHKYPKTDYYNTIEYIFPVVLKKKKTISFFKYFFTIIYKMISKNYLKIN